MLLLIALCGCDKGGGATAGGIAISRPLAVVVSCDTAGWIVPCGCSSKQAGGLPRRATHVLQIGVASDVLVADAGGAPGGKSPYDRKKFEYLLRGEAEIQTVAHNIGAAEAQLGAVELRRLQGELSAPFVSANVVDADGQNICPSHQLVARGDTRFVVVGVLSPKFATAGLKVADPAESSWRGSPRPTSSSEVPRARASLRAAQAPPCGGPRRIKASFSCISKSAPRMLPGTARSSSSGQTWRTMRRS
ncbi:MAG: hypothetical protein HY290_04605 [Planctomycetia bacterium]|nr:hypothetical protein [Planctomycetia bacterium]